MYKQSSIATNSFYFSFLFTFLLLLFAHLSFFTFQSYLILLILLFVLSFSPILTWFSFRDSLIVTLFRFEWSNFHACDLSAIFALFYSLFHQIISGILSTNKKLISLNNLCFSLHVFYQFEWLYFFLVKK